MASWSRSLRGKTIVRARRDDLKRLDGGRLDSLVRLIEAELDLIAATPTPAEPAAAAAQTLFELLSKKDVNQLKERFPQKVAPQVTPQSVALGHRQHAAAQTKGMSIQVDPGTEPDTWVVTRNGVRLTGLVARNGRWLADTVWFAK